MNLPPEVIVEIRSMFAEIADGKSCSVTIHTSGKGQWTAELNISSKILVATASFDVATKTYTVNGKNIRA